MYCWKQYSKTSINKIFKYWNILNNGDSILLLTIRNKIKIFLKENNKKLTIQIILISLLPKSIHFYLILSIFSCFKHSHKKTSNQKLKIYVLQLIDTNFILYSTKLVFGSWQMRIMKEKGKHQPCGLSQALESQRNNARISTAIYLQAK